MQTEPLLYEAYVKTGRVYQVYRNFPLDSHANAAPAAKAALCSGEQDAKLFWEMHDWLFANQATWQGASDAAAQFRAEAVSLGADGAQYDACVANAATQAAIEKDVDEGTALGVRGTPAFFLSTMEGGKPVGDAKPLSGARPFAQFAGAIDELLDQ